MTASCYRSRSPELTGNRILRGGRRLPSPAGQAEYLGHGARVAAQLSPSGTDYRDLARSSCFVPAVSEQRT